MDHLPYLPHQQRVVDELEELSTRLGKLNSFIGSAKFNEVGVQAERDLLLKQAGQMTAYWMTLHERIALWKSHEPVPAAQFVPQTEAQALGAPPYVLSSGGTQ
jgi:hypothetical protein